MMHIKINDDFASRFSEARKKIKITQAQLSNELGINQATIAAYESGRIKPKQKTLLKIAYLLGVTPEWLTTGNDNKLEQGFNASIAPTIEVKQIPLYTMDELIQIEFKNTLITNPTLRPCLASASEKAFATKIVSDDMTSNSASYSLNYISFPPSSIVTFDRLFDKKSGDCYLVKLNNMLTFKQLYFGDFETTFRPLNNAYSDYKVPNEKYEIIAVAIYVEINLQPKDKVDPKNFKDNQSEVDPEDFKHIPGFGSW